MRIGNFGAILLGSIFLVIAIFLTIILFGWTTPVQNLLQLISNNVIYSGLAAAGFLLLSVLSFSMVKVGGKEQISISASTKFGQIRISDRTIEGIVTKTGQSIEGIKELNAKIHPLPDGINILIKAVTNPDFVIPEVVEQMQSLVKEEVEKQTGLRVGEVKVMVQSIDGSGATRMK